MGRRIEFGVRKRPHPRVETGHPDRRPDVKQGCAAAQVQRPCVRIAHPERPVGVRPYLKQIVSDDRELPWLRVVN